MGKQAAKEVMFSFLAACALLLIPIRAEAADVADLYAVYDMEYEVSIPEEIVTTISNYNNAKKYVYMYNYVANSEYDTKVLEQQIAIVDEELREIEQQLLNGYSLSQSTLFDLEDTYVALTERKYRLESSLISYDVSDASVSVDSVPTYSEYMDALRTKNDLLAMNDIGNITDLVVPVQSKARLLEHTNDSSEYRVIDNTGILSPFNGVVEDTIVDDEWGLTLIINNYNGVKTYLCNLESIEVMPGSTVYQNQRVGFVLGTRAVFRMSLDDEFVDISKIFVEGLSL